MQKSHERQRPKRLESGQGKGFLRSRRLNVSVPINLGYEHGFALPTGVLTLRAQSHYETSSCFTVYNNDYDKQDAYTRSGVIATYRPDAGF